LRKFEHAQCFWVSVKQSEGATDRSAGQKVPAFVLLECAWSATDNPACFYLAYGQFLADTTDFFGLKESLPREP
jgi:hypothetical protein